MVSSAKDSGLLDDRRKLREIYLGAVVADRRSGIRTTDQGIYGIQVKKVSFSSMEGGREYLGKTRP